MTTRPEHRPIPQDPVEEHPVEEHPGRHRDPSQDTDRDTGTEERPDAAEFEDRWRRALADLDNLRKRTSRELVRERAAEKARVAGAFLPVLDNIDLALRHADADPGAVVEGIRAIRDQALTVLAMLGYPRQDEAGVPFDPARHEVVALVTPQDDTPPGSVVEVVRPGYGEPEQQQLRPASVTVARDQAS